jgi:hypothetical protein
MNKVFLIVDNILYDDLIYAYLVSFLDADIEKTSSAAEFINSPGLHTDTALIISQNKIGSENSAEIIQKYIVDNQMTCHLIILGSNDLQHNDFISTIEDPKNWEKLITKASKFLGISEETLAKRATPDYAPVSIRYFLNLDSVNCDVYIRIKKTPIDYQLVKRFHCNDTFTKDNINHYIDLGLELFYIPKDNLKDFIAFLSLVLVKNLETPNLELTEKLEIMGESYDVATKEILNLGLTPEVVKLTDTIIENMVHNVEQSPGMTSLLTKVINAQTPFGFQRCHMTAAVATECLKNLMMTQDASILDFTFASFFHDIALADKMELSLINTKEELLAANLVDIEKDLVLNHAVEAATLIYKYPNVPKGVEDLIMEHHGVPFGFGFTNNIEELSMTSQVFIIAHDFVLEILKYKENKTIPRSITADLHKKYPGKSCTKIINALEHSLIQKKTIAK